MRQEQRLPYTNRLAGFGKALRSTILPRTAEIRRFPDAGHCTAGARCVKSGRIRNRKRKNRNCCRTWAFSAVAHFGIIWAPKFKTCDQRKLTNAHLMVVCRTVVDRIARTGYCRFKNQTPIQYRTGVCLSCRRVGGLDQGFRRGQVFARPRGMVTDNGSPIRVVC